MRNNEEYETTIETIVAICIALQLPPVISQALISRSAYSLGSGPKFMTYHFLLEACYTKTIFECNDILRGVNLAPLTKEK